jgi:hypothetical protein
MMMTALAGVIVFDQVVKSYLRLGSVWEGGLPHNFKLKKEEQDDISKNILCPRFGDWTGCWLPGDGG